MIMSASCAPAFSSISGCAPWPTKPRTSRLSRTARIRVAEVSITDTSLRSAASRSAMPYPTWPAPQVMTRMPDPERLQFPVQCRAFHTDEFGGARDIAAETVDLRDQIFLLEQFARLAQRQRHDVLVRLVGRARHDIADFGGEQVGGDRGIGLVVT